MKNPEPPIIVEQHFSTGIYTVWQAITQPGQMRQWFFENMEDFSPQVGFETQFNVETPGGDFLHLWKITEVEPMRKIVYDWRYGGYPGDSSVTFELFEAKGGTTLRLTHEGIESFPQEVPEFSRESCAGGWHYFIQERLPAFVERKK